MAEKITSIILQRHRLLLAIICMLAFAAIIPASQVRFDNAIEIWFLDDDPGLAIYNQFSEQFQADEIAVVGVFHDDIFRNDILSVIDRITTAAEELDNVFRVQSITNSTLATRANEGFLEPNFRKIVMASPVMNGTMVSPDGAAAAIVVYYSRAGEAVELKYRFVAALEAIATREIQDSTASFVLTGAPVMGKVGQVKNHRDMVTLVPAMIFIILLITFSVFRNIWLTLLPLAVVTISVIWSFAFMGVLGWRMTMISAMLMPLILAVGVADTIHVVARFRDQLGQGANRLQAVRNSLLQLLKPCFFTTITTMIGLLALLVSEIGPVRQFGVVAAVGVLAAFLVSITLVPASLLIIPVGDRGRARRTEDIIGGFLKWVNLRSRNRPGMIISFTLLVVVSSGWLATRVTVGLDPLTWFPSGDPFRVATERVDEAFGGSLSMEFLVAAPANNLNEPAVLRRLESFQSWLIENTEITRAFSIADMVKEAARMSREEGAAGYMLPRTKFVIDALLDVMSRAGQLEGWLLPDYSSARVSARIPAAGAKEIVRQTPAIRNYLQNEFSDGELRVQMTGHAVLVGEMQDYVIRSQAASFSVALIAISVLMFLLLRSLSLGMLAMIPNLIPLLVGLGAMTLLGMDLNPGTVMITAVALGIVVDDTVHFMTALKFKSRETADISLAVEQAINSVGRPVVVTSVLLTLGFSVMLFGGFLPSRQIGGISALIIIIALLADLLLLPAALRLLPKRFSS